LSKIISLLIFVFLLFSDQITSFAAENKTPVVKSEAAVVLDTENGAVLYSKNPEERLYPASLTKIATAIYAIEKGNLDDIVTVSKNAASQEGTRVYLVEGEKVSLKSLIQGMLINSGNDAAVAVAEHIDGSVGRFAENINKYLKTNIGVYNTHFTNPNGLFDPNHYTTAMDLALITNYAKKNQVFSEIFGTKELPWNGESWHTTLITHHLMLKGEIPFPGITVTGGKTGFVEESKSTLATTAENGKLKLTAIILKAANKQTEYNDTKEILDYSFNNYKHTVVNHNNIFKSGNKEFLPRFNTVVTEPIVGSVTTVNSDGLLSVKSTGGQLVESVKLEQKAINKIHLKSKLKEKVHYTMNAIYGMTIFACAMIILNVRKKLIRRKY
jgi:serine-type D-Ala-D-Ala carboxypeptidase (penicillin-binding protein 5/6)